MYLSERHYLDIHVLLSKTLRSDFSIKDAYANAQADWKADKAEPDRYIYVLRFVFFDFEMPVKVRVKSSFLVRYGMTEGEFSNLIFETADIWTDR